MNDDVGGGEFIAAGPAAVLDAENVERKRLRADGYDAIFADDAPLSSSPARRMSGRLPR
jgi:hypothetical protein